MKLALRGRGRAQRRGGEAVAGMYPAGGSIRVLSVGPRWAPQRARILSDASEEEWGKALGTTALCLPQESATDFPLSLAVTHPLHIWGPDSASSPEISGTFCLGHLGSLSFCFFGYNEEL